MTHFDRIDNIDNTKDPRQQLSWWQQRAQLADKIVQRLAEDSLYYLTETEALAEAQAMGLAFERQQVRDVMVRDLYENPDSNYCMHLLYDTATGESQIALTTALTTEKARQQTQEDRNDDPLGIEGQVMVQVANMRQFETLAQRLRVAYEMDRAAPEALAATKH